MTCPPCKGVWFKVVKFVVPYSTYINALLQLLSLFCFLLFPTDKMKDASIAKLANQAADFYGDAFKQCQYKENLPKVCA